MGRHLRSLLLRIYRRLLAAYDIVVDAVLDVGSPVGNAEDPLGIGFVLREQQRHIAFTVQVALAQFGIDCLDHTLPGGIVGLGETRPIGSGMPGPLVPEPERRQDVQLGRFRAAVVDGNLDQDVLGGLFGILHEHVEVAILVEHAGINQFIFQLVPSPATAGLDKVSVRKCRLWILVEILHVRVGRSAVEVEVVLLDILSVIALAVGQPEQALLQDRVLSIPEGERKAEPLLVIRNAGQPVLAPAVGAGAGLIVSKVVPGVAAFAVILAHGSPLPFAEVGSPLLPRSLLLPSLLQAELFCSHDAPPNGSKRQSEHVFVVSRHWLKIRLVSRVERLAMVPRVFNGRKTPEAAFGIPHNPLLARPVHKQGHQLFA
jgi:hypothetical protein